MEETQSAPDGEGHRTGSLTSGARERRAQVLEEAALAS
jgi:hypothetical protein